MKKVRVPKVPFSLMLFLPFILILSACAPAESNLAVENAWARAAMTSSATDSAGMNSAEMDMSADDTAMNEDDAMAEEDTAAEKDSAMEDTSGAALSGATSAVYLTLNNTGGAADRLISASTEAAGTVELHMSSMDDQGVMRMTPLTDGIEIPANGSATLEPGGMHIMLMNLQQDLVAGETIDVTLTFESEKTLTIQAEIRNP